MLVLQVPIADLRLFQTTPAGVVGPGWQYPPDPQRRGFLRGIGGVRRRRSESAGRVDQWANAAWFVEARSAFKATFATAAPSAHFPRTTVASKKSFGIERVFRRIYSDGGPLWHLQLGVQLGLTFPQTEAVFRALVEDVLDLQVQLPPSAADAFAAPPAPLLKQRKAIVQRIADATTSRRRSSLSPGILLSGKPLLYVETRGRYRFADTDPSEYLNITRPLSGMETIKGAPLQLHVDLLRRHKPDECLLLWLESGAAPGRGARNQLRTNLLCLHAELEVLKLVLRKADSLGVANAALERYLGRAHEMMSRQWLGNEQQALRDALVAYDALTGEEVAVVRKLLNDRRQSLARAEEIMRSIGNSPVYFIEKVGVMNTQLNIHGNVNGIINYNATINAAQNVVNNVASPDLKAALEQLLVESGKLGDALPVAERGKVAALTKAVVDEATAPKPDSAKLQISKNGLIEAAKAVAGMAPSIATAVGAVLGILGFA